MTEEVCTPLLCSANSQDAWTPIKWRDSGLVDTNMVESFRTRGHAKSGEFGEVKCVFLFSKHISMNYKPHNSDH